MTHVVHTWRIVQPPIWALIVAAAASALSSCAVGPLPQAPSVETQGLAPSFRASMDIGPTTPPEQWWRRFNDPVLLSLIDQGLMANSDVAVATLRLRQARANLVASQGAFWPSLGASVGRSRSEGSHGLPATNLTQTSITAAYELDLFGGTRRAVTAARADRDSVAETRRSTAISVSAEIALNYVQARAATRRLELATNSLAAQADTLQLVRWRAMAGLASDVEVEQAAQLYAQTQSTLPDLRQLIDGAFNRLSTLTDATPGRIAEQLTGAADVPVAPMPEVSIPVDALRQRPDVRVAERTVVAELARVGVREAALLPALTLGGSYSGAGVNWAAATAAPTLQLTGLLAASLFRGGQDWAALESQKAAAAAAAATYRGVVHAAMEDLENALLTVRASREKAVALADADQAAQRALELARLRYQSGLIDFQSLLDTERTALTSAQSLIQSQADRATAAIRLYKALGAGGLDPTGPRVSERSDR